MESSYTIVNPLKTSHLVWKIKTTDKNSIQIDKYYGVLEPEEQIKINIKLNTEKITDMKSFVNMSKLTLQVKNSTDCTKEDEKLTQVELIQKAKFKGTDDEKAEIKIEIDQEHENIDEKINLMTSD